jgi:pimeloyl-ACP methyl ester carboxylesterase
MLQWLTMGSEMVEPQLHRIAAPVLVVAGTVDRLLPSFEEAKRLQKELPKCTVHYASKSASHWMRSGRPIF